MKRLVFFLLVIGMGMSLFAQVQLPEHSFASGSWTESNNRLYQNDANARLAKVNIKAPQSGSMLYEFNARYESGAEDGHGGFGLHIFADNVYNGPSWGSGKSWLLWLNYDENPSNNAIPKGLSAQVYRSYTNSRMELVQNIDLNQYVNLLTPENLTYSVPFRIWVNGDTGEVRVYDPTDPDLASYFYFNIDKKDVPLKGDWVALRTNGIKLSFATGLGSGM
ncbi:MAG: hypothetical protein LBT14_00765 [Treponema sp.]|jgi:hypothetical protein|nr:hypothetical protein [Treponema sp.]